MLIGSLLLNRYRLDAEFGHGGMGVVYRAHDTLLDRDVAVKVLSAPGGGSGGRARLLREAQAAAQLNHPNIVSVYDVGFADEADHVPFIVMELVEGESLHRRRPQSLPEILSVARQVCAALDHAHAHGIVHRDLKPENVLLTPEGAAKLADFGLARTMASRLTVEGTLIGTVFYLAPEQALGEAVDGRADLYALGVILYELTTGRLPFTGDDPIAIISQHLHAPVVPARTHQVDLPPALDAIILKLLAKTPGDRFASAREVGAALAATAVQLQSTAEPRHNLPVQLSSFVGRERELAQVKRMVTTSRLVTLVGAGGCGKTRLALEVAAPLITEYPDGVWLIELGALSDPALIVQKAASVLGLGEESDRPLLDMLIDYLREKNSLLVLDNCEHLVSACAPLAETLLQACPNLRIVATSRETLGIAGESTFGVPSLSVPDPGRLPPGGAEEDFASDLLDYEGVRLFIERARAVQPSFKLTNENAAAVAQICYRLDGIPLAIELAAARVKALSVEQIAARLDDRFRLLTGGSRTALPRHQTLQALIDWSYDLLSDVEQVLLRRLSVFAGGWTLEASESVCAGDGIQADEVLDLLTRFVDKSLVLVEERNGEARYRMLDTIQQYAREKALQSGDAARVRERHLGFFMKVAEEAESHLRSAAQLKWLNRLEAEAPNLRAALGWSQASGETEPGLRLAGALFWFWLLRGYTKEGRKWLEGMLSGGSRRSPARAKALWAAGFLAVGQGDIVAGRSRLDESLALFRELGDQKGTADSLLGLGRAAYYQGDYVAALSLFEESLALSRAVEYSWGSAQALYRLGMVILVQGDYAQARLHFEESVLKFRDLGDRWGLSYSLTALGEEALRRGDYALAHTVMEESLRVFQELGSKSGIAMSLSELGWLALSQGDYLAARSRLEESLALRREMGYRGGMAIALNLLGDVALRQGNYQQAKALIDKSLALRKELGSKSGIAWSLQNLGYLAQHQGDYRQAAALFEESLVLFVELGNKIGIAECLEGLASVAAAEGPLGAGTSERHALGSKAERAVRLLGGAEALREVASTPLPPYRRADYDRDIALVRAQLDDSALASAWEAGRAMTIEQAVAYALEEMPQRVSTPLDPAHRRG